MRPISALISLTLAAFAGAAPTSTTWYARAEAKGNGIEALFEFWGYKDGSPTQVAVKVIKGLVNDSPYFQGPYMYHFHTNPVGKEQNCTKALAHLDPLHLSEGLKCGPNFPQYCQEGDLSGKHGMLEGTSSGTLDTVTYSDDYIRFFPEDLSILGRSIVIHAANKTRLACGDIYSTLDGTASDPYTPTYKPSNYVKNYPTAAPVQPAQVVDPFAGTTFPDEQTLQNLPFPLGNPAISLSQSLNVVLKTQSQTVWVNGTQTQAELPIEEATSAAPPF